MACQGVPVYKITVLNFREDLSQLINKLQSLIKEYILSSLQITTTIIKIKAETTTKIITKTTLTLTVIEYTDNQILTVDLRDIAISTKKRIVVYRDIQKRNIIRLKKSIKAALVIKLKDGLITVLKNILSSILLTIKKIIVKT